MYQTGDNLSQFLNTLDYRLRTLENRSTTGTVQAAATSGGTVSGDYVLKSGDTMSGTLTLNSGLLGTSATFSGNVVVSGTLTVSGGGSFAQDSLVVHLAGAETLTGTKSFHAEQRFDGGGVYADPDTGVARAIKVGAGGLAVLGGTKTDSLTASGAVNFTGTLNSAGGVFSSAIIANGGMQYGAASFLDLSPVATTISATGTGVGDKIALNANNYGLGVQTNRLVAYVASGAEFAVRTTSATGNLSSGADAVRLSASGNIIATGSITANAGLTVVSGAVSLPPGAITATSLGYDSITGTGVGAQGAGYGQIAFQTVGEYNMANQSITTRTLSPALLVANSNIDGMEFGKLQPGTLTTDGLFLGLGGHVYAGPSVLPVGTYQARLDLNSGGLEAYDGTVRTFYLQANGSLDLKGSITAGSTITGTTLTGTTGISAGTGNAIFIAGASGIQLGNAAFASAPFSVSMAGALVATAATITGTVTASTVTASNFDATNTITGQAITSRTVTADKISVGVSTSDDLLSNGSFVDVVGTTTQPAGWTLDWMSIGSVLGEGVSTARALSGSTSLGVNVAVSGGRGTASTTIPVIGGEVYSISWSMLAETLTGPFYFEVFFGDVDDFPSTSLNSATPNYYGLDLGPAGAATAAASAGTVRLLNAYNLPALTTWYNFRGYVQVPAGVRFMRVVPIVWANATGAWTGYIDGVTVRKQITGTEIRDGSIITRNMTANTISGTVITTNTLTADKISTGTLSASTLVTAGTAGSTRVELDGRSGFAGVRLYDSGGIVKFNADAQAGSVSITGAINATSGTFSGSITSSATITGGTISGSTITGSSLAAEQINSGYLSAARLQAGTIDSTKILLGDLDSSVFGSGIGGNLATDSSYEDANLSALLVAQASPGFSRTTTAGRAYDGLACLTGNGATVPSSYRACPLFNKFIPVTPGERFTCTIWVNRVSGDGTLYLDSEGKNAASTTVTFPFGTSILGTTATGWTRYTYTILIPDNVYYWRPRVQMNNNVTTGLWDWDLFTCVKAMTQPALASQGRVQVDPSGLFAWDSSGAQTVSIDGASGNASFKGTVTGSTIVGSSMSAEQIDSGYLASGRINASTISSSQLTLATQAAYVVAGSTNICPNPGFENFNLYTQQLSFFGAQTNGAGGAQFYTQPNSGAPKYGTYHMLASGNVATGNYPKFSLTGYLVPTQPGEKWYCGAWVRADTGTDGSAQLQLVTYGPTANTVGYPGFSGATIQGTTSPGNYVWIEGTYTMPDGIYFFTPNFQINSGGTTGYWRVDGVQLQQIATRNNQNARVDLSPLGLYAYNSAGTQTVSISGTTGNATFSGTVTGSTISGSTISGSNIDTLQDTGGYTTIYGSAINMYYPSRGALWQASQLHISPSGSSTVCTLYGGAASSTANRSALTLDLTTAELSTPGAGRYLYVTASDLGMYTGTSYVRASASRVEVFSNPNLRVAFESPTDASGVSPFVRPINAQGYGGTLAYGYLAGTSGQRFQFTDLGNAAYIPLWASGFTVSSDARHKTAESPLSTDDSIALIRGLKPKKYSRISPMTRHELAPRDPKKKGASDPTIVTEPDLLTDEVGLVAQDVAALAVTIPNLVQDSGDPTLGQSIDLYALLTTTIAALQHVDARLLALEGTKP